MLLGRGMIADRQLTASRRYLGESLKFSHRDRLRAAIGRSPCNGPVNSIQIPDDGVRSR
jgi:hypothetical protein